MLVWSEIGGGESVPLEVLGGFGGAFEENGFSIAGGTSGEWIASSFLSNSIPAGYYHFITLTISGLGANGCEPGSFVFTTGEVRDQSVSFFFFPKGGDLYSKRVLRTWAC